MIRLKLKSPKVEEKLGGISSIHWIHVIFSSMIHSADFLEKINLWNSEYLRVLASFPWDISTEGRGRSRLQWVEGPVTGELWMHNQDWKGKNAVVKNGKHNTESHLILDGEDIKKMELCLLVAKIETDSFIYTISLNSLLKLRHWLQFSFFTRENWSRWLVYGYIPRNWCCSLM